MRATWRPLPAWPYPPSAPSSAGFRVDWLKTLRDLGDEIERVAGSEVLIGIVADDADFFMDGTPKAGFADRVKHPGAEVSFERADVGRVTFHTDAFKRLQGNLRAITLGLEALRAVDRYGITTSGEQYAGFAMIGSGEPDAERGRKLVERHGGIAAALKATHPDHGGNARDLADVQRFRARQPVASR